MPSSRATQYTVTERQNMLPSFRDAEIDCLGNSIRKHELRGAIKGALKKTKLDEVRQRLESAKTTCVLAG